MSALINLSGSAEFGFGYGLLVDASISALCFAIYYLPIHNSLDLSGYNLKRSIDLDFRNRIVSTTHGFISFSLCFRVAFFYW